MYMFGLNCTWHFVGYGDIWYSRHVIFIEFGWIGDTSRWAVWTGPEVGCRKTPSQSTSGKRRCGTWRHRRCPGFRNLFEGLPFSAVRRPFKLKSRDVTTTWTGHGNMMEHVDMGDMGYCVHFSWWSLPMPFLLLYLPWPLLEMCSLPSHLKDHSAQAQKCLILGRSWFVSRFMSCSCVWL